MSRPYEQVTLSMFVDDVDELDEQVAALKRAGYKQASRSALVRYALRVVRVQSTETLIAELKVHRANERLKGKDQ